jgi:hypothetical protein
VSAGACVGRVELHAVGDELQHALVADGEAVQRDEARAHLHERHTPDLADGVHLVRRVRADGAAREGAVGEVDLRGVDVGE